MSKPTEGPWKVGTDHAGYLAVLPERYGETLPDGFLYLPVVIARVPSGANRPEAEAAANARLIAAAPDLLDALEEVDAWAQKMPEGMRRRVRLAIEKATKGA